VTSHGIGTSEVFGLTAPGIFLLDAIGAITLASS
jgi:hypothetical protein